MKKYQVKITEQALKQMKDIHEYIYYVSMSIDQANRLYDKIFESILSLDINPKRIKVMKTRFKELEEIRQMIVDNYSIFFVIIDNLVIVFAILYTAMNIDSKLEGVIFSDIDKILH